MKKHTPEEIQALALEKERINPAYLAEQKRQIEEWVKGNNIHNSLPFIVDVVDENGKIVDYYRTDDGECCPDFACCLKDASKHWPLSLRQRFKEAVDRQDEETCHNMLMMSLSNLTQEAGKKIYIAGEDNAQH